LLEQQHGNETNETLQQLRHSTILTDSDWEYFRDLFEKVHTGFLQRLKEKMPGLTPAETRFIVLSKLGLSGKEMAAMLGIGTDAISQIRSRVKKKLNLQEESSLDDMLTIFENSLESGVETSQTPDFSLQTPRFYILSRFCHTPCHAILTLKTCKKPFDSETLVHKATDTVMRQKPSSAAPP
jgi:DNA-binding CsgD family transcriptional regulator